jgi:hypothetical protein
MSPRAALTGSLRELPLNELLQLLGASRHQGVIEFTGAAGGLVVLEDGDITLALADDGPTLAEVVIGSGLTGAEGWERAHLASMRGESLADALVDVGVDPDELELVLRDQTIGALFEFVLPSDTRFAFLEGATHPLGGRFRFAATDLLAEANERVHVWKVIAESIPSTAMVMRLAPELGRAAITIDADDWRVLALVDGRTTIADLIRALGMSAFAVCVVLHRLVQEGAVEPVPTR